MATDKNAIGRTPTPEVDSRKRSPRYPIVAIDDALDRVRLIYNEDRRAYAALNAVLEHMGYKVREKRGGRSARMVATLRQYGLLDERDGQYRVSDTAFRIIELPEDSPERAQLIRRAAVSPPIISKVLRHYNGELPSDTTLRSYLVLEEEFNPDSAAEFIRVLRRTMEIANPTEADYNAGDAGQPKGESKPAQEIPPMRAPAGSPHVGPSQQSFGTGTQTPAQSQFVQFRQLDGTPIDFEKPTDKKTELAFKLSRSSEARVVIYGDASQDAIKKLRALLELQEDTFPTAAEIAAHADSQTAAETAAREGYRTAIWRNKDHDQPVTITGEMGEKDGRRFYAAKETSTGIPEDELEFQDVKAKGAA